VSPYREVAFAWQVKRGIWRTPQPAPAPEEPETLPTFHQFASEWFSRHRGEWAERTIEQYEGLGSLVRLDGTA
jgi:hypothetical protein